MNNDSPLLFLFGFIIGAAITGFIFTGMFHHEAIRHGAAQYNQTNAVFEWKENK